MDCAEVGGDRSLTCAWRKLGQAAMLGLSAGAALSGAAQAQSAQQAQVQVQRGLRFDISEQQLAQRVRNTVTAMDLEEGQPRFTAWDVDPMQSSKKYHDPRSLEVDEGHSGRTVTEGPMMRQCSKQAESGECRQVKPNQIRYSVLSCIYRNEGDSQLYRVTHRSYQHNYTHPMHRNVCGGHELVYDNAQMTYMPRQVNREGDQLFLNPANILRIEPVTGHQVQTGRPGP